MAKLFGSPINVEAEEEGGGGSSVAEDGEAMSLLSDGVPQRESNPYSESTGSAGPMESESDLHNCFIDFFGRDSFEIATVGREFYSGRNQIPPDVDIWGGSDVMEEEIELGLGIGSGHSGITGNKETDSGRVEVGTDLTPFEDDLFGCTPFEDDLFCEEEAMLMADEELEWENLQNGITWESEPVQASLEEEEEEDDTEEEEEEEEGEVLVSPYRAEFLLPVNDDAFVDDFYEESLDILIDSMEGTDLMDLDYGAFLATIHELGENHGDYDDVFAQTFNQEPSSVMGNRPASKSVIDDLPVVDITSEELSKGNVVCAVCIGDFVVEEKVTRLPCRHCYHGECILPWLGMRNTCPVCRYELPTDDL